MVNKTDTTTRCISNSGFRAFFESLCFTKILEFLQSVVLVTATVHTPNRCMKPFEKSSCNSQHSFNGRTRHKIKEGEKTPNEKPQGKIQKLAELN